MEPSEIPQHAAEPAAPEVMAVLRRWDPIGVISERNQDEYDSYSFDVVRRLDRGASVDDVVDYLRWVVTDRMGMSYFDEAHRRDCAQELVDYWPSRYSRCPGSTCAAAARERRRLADFKL